VIWFPKGDGPTTKGDGVTVVFGNSKGLKGAIKAPIGRALFKSFPTMARSPT
jgi:hypothetical protein